MKKSNGAQRPLSQSTSHKNQEDGRVQHQTQASDYFINSPIEAPNGNLAIQNFKVYQDLRKKMESSI